VAGVNELVVVTLLVAADGDFQLPTISSTADLKLALSRLGGIPPDNVVGLEVLWTPQAEGDTFTQNQLVADYPSLVPL
jgi:uncharacterized membrane protein